MIAVLERQLLLPVQVVPKRLALDVGHDVVEEAAGFPGVVQRQDVRVVQRGRDLDLAQEPLRAQGGGQPPAQDPEPPGGAA